MLDTKGNKIKVCVKGVHATSFLISNKSKLWIEINPKPNHTNYNNQLTLFDCC